MDDSVVFVSNINLGTSIVGWLLVASPLDPLKEFLFVFPAPLLLLEELSSYPN
jgi:hypothetical protein